MKHLMHNTGRELVRRNRVARLFDPLPSAPEIDDRPKAPPPIAGTVSGNTWLKPPTVSVKVRHSVRDFDKIIEERNDPWPKIIEDERDERQWRVGQIFVPTGWPGRVADCELNDEMKAMLGKRLTVRYIGENELVCQAGWAWPKQCCCKRF